MKYFLPPFSSYADISMAVVSYSCERIGTEYWLTALVKPGQEKSC